MRPNLAFHMEVLSRSLEFFDEWDAQTRQGRSTAFHAREAECVIAEAKESLAYLRLNMTDDRRMSDPLEPLYKKVGNG